MVVARQLDLRNDPYHRFDSLRLDVSSVRPVLVLNEIRGLLADIPNQIEEAAGIDPCHTGLAARFDPLTGGLVVGSGDNPGTAQDGGGDRDPSETARDPHRPKT